MKRFLSRFAAFCVALIACTLIASPAAAKDKPRVKLVMSSADRVLGDLEWLISTLAKEKSVWENTIFPSLDIFLLGVDRDKPIRFDVMIGGEEPGAVNPGSYRLQPSIPVERDGKGIKTFTKQNLEPIGIAVKRKARRGYYQLSKVFDGWMRMVDEYACIATYESDVPKGMPHPEKSHKELLKSGYDLALELDNDPKQTQERTEAFDVLAANLLDATKLKEGESEAAFALRKATLNQNLEKFGRLFKDAKRVTVGWITDVDKESGRAELYGEGLPETDLAAFIDMISVEHSMFAALPMPEDPTACLRVNLPYSEMRKRHLAELYRLFRPVAHEKIDAAEQITSSEKAPAKQISDLFFDMLETGIGVGRLDLFLDMTKAESGKHVIIVGIRATDGKRADEIVKLIPQAHADWSVEMDADSVGVTAIHKLDITTNLPMALVETFGKSGAVYVGTSADLVWICGGEGALDLLKETITQVNESKPPADVSPVFGEFKLHAHTLLKMYDSLVIEMGWNPLGKIDLQPKGNAGDGPGLQPIDPAEIRDIATRATADIDDRVSGTASRIGNHAEGEILVAPGVLRAVGKIIAKIAADNL